MTPLRRAIFGLLTLVTLGFLVLQVFYAGFHNSQESLLNNVLSYLLLAFSILVFISIVLYGASLLIAVVRRLLSYVGTAVQFRETSLLNKLTGLLVAALLFPDVFRSLYEIALRFFTELFIELPRTVLRVVMEGMGCIEATGRIAECAAIMTNAVGGGLANVFNGLVFRTGISGFDVVSFVFAVVVFIVASVGLQQAWHQLSSQPRLWLAYAAIAIAGLYLALSATLAVGLLREPGHVVEISPERLRARLESAYLTSTVDIDGSTPLLWGQGETLAALGAEDGKAIDALPIWVQLGLSQADKALRDIEQYGQDVATRRLQLSQSRSANRMQMIENAVDLYETESAVRLGQREASRHYLDLLNWFLRNVEQSNAAIASCERAEKAIDSIRQDARAEWQSLIASLQSRAPSSAVADPIALNEVEPRLIGIVDNMFLHMRRAGERSSECWGWDSSVGSPPVRQVYGSQLGPVGAATRWLLGAESMPVTLVAGLVGFGLLGALAGRFVRGEPRGGDDVGEVAMVVFGGFVAALVVYLAAYGGIAVVSENSGDPNAYVVFAACLVGAVYSGDVWERARDRLLGSRDQKSQAKQVEESDPEVT
jgi:hypothetical protein